MGYGKTQGEVLKIVEAAVQKNGFESNWRAISPKDVGIAFVKGGL